MTRCTIGIAVLCSLASTALAAQMPKEKSCINSIGMKLLRIEPGEFEMGFGNKPLPDEVVTKKSHFAAGDFDEQPTHTVRITKPFYMAQCEVTNAQYEQFDPSHKEQRGRDGYSKADDEAVVYVNWHDAAAFCKWLSEKEGLPYRLPSEAEWEYACRAGTTTPFCTGNTPGAILSKEEGDPLTVASTPANPWGLYDMHGNVEEWCYDWYGPYEPQPQTDPVGRADGDFKVTRGGSHSTEPYYLRSSNRLGCHPDDRQYMIGFRIVLGEMPTTEPLPTPPPERYQRNVRQNIPRDVTKGPDPDKPYFKGPRPYVRIPQGSQGPLFREHNHFGAITECPNGDLLAAWFTCEEEMGRELGIAASRLRYGREEWEPASSFWDAPDRNDHTHTLWYDGKGNIWHFNGLAIKYRRLALLLRKSSDNGATWSKARIILDHNDTHPNKVHESVFRAQSGEVIVPFDGPGGSVLAVSRDEGKNWFDPGGSIRGRHAGVLQLADGRLMAFGRHGAIEGKMPMSISADMGKTWTYAPSPFQPIHTGRRLALMRLKQGQLFIASFCNQMMVTDISGVRRPVTGLFAALSTDEGKTWPYRRLVSDDGPRREVGTMDGDPIIMDASNSEPVGYLAACQGPDGIINLVSSYQHYAFNAKWLMTLPPVAPPAPPPPTFKMIPLKADLPHVYEPKGLPGEDAWQWSFSARNFKESDVIALSADGLLKIDTNDQQQFWLRTEKKEIFGAVDPKKGFTAEIKTQVLKRSPDQRGVDFELYDGAGSRYAITITDSAVYWYEGTVMSSALLPFSQYIPLAEDLNNTDKMHTYRIAVRKDRVAQIYRDGALLGTKPVKYRTPRSPYIYFGAGPGLEALVEYVSYDLDGPYAPPPLVRGLAHLPYLLKDCILDTTDPEFSHEGASPAADWKHWPQFDVHDYGAVGDGHHPDTEPIQKAVDAASESGGGTVVLRAGVFLSGAIFLKPGSAFVIEKDAVLRGTTDESRYPTIKTRIAGVDMPWPAGILNADRIHGVRVAGAGTIDGQGQYWWRKWNNQGPLGALGVGKPRPIIVSRSRDVYIADLTIKNSPFWTCHVVYCQDVDINNITIRNAIEGIRAPSSDGIDIDSCRNALVRNCDIDCDDDCIVIKSGRDGDGFRRNAPSENIVVRNCIARRGHGMVAIGTEIAGSVRNVYVRDCRAQGTKSGVRFKSKIGRGGVVENIVYENITMKNVDWAIRMRLTDTRSNFPQLVEPKIPVLGGELAIPRFRNILLKNISAVDSGSCFSFRLAKTAPPVENMTFENVELHGAEDIDKPDQARWKNWDTRSLTVNGKKLFGDASAGAPPGLYETVIKATTHVGPLER